MTRPLGDTEGTKTASAESQLLPRWTQCLVLKYAQSKATAPEHGLNSLFAFWICTFTEKNPQNNTMKDNDILNTKEIG